MNEKKALINYLKEAFMLPSNLAVLAVMSVLTIGAAIVGAAVGHIPILEQLSQVANWRVLLFMTAAYESFYLALMPNSPRFVRAVNARKMNMLKKLEQDIQTLEYITRLGQPLLESYQHFYQRKLQILENLAKNATGVNLSDDTFLNRLNSLEAQYVFLLYQIDLFSRYASQPSLNKIEDEIHRLEADREAATSPKVREMVQRRIDLLRKRNINANDVAESLQLARIQLDTLEDTISYLTEQSLHVHNLNDISRAIDAVITESEARTETIRDMSEFMSDFNFGGTTQESGPGKVRLS